MRVVVTGIGAVTPSGIGKDALALALREGRPLPGPVARFGGRFSGSEVKDFAFESLFDDRRFRRASMVTKFSLVAAKLALKDAGLKDTPGGLEGIKAAVVSGVTHGSLAFSCDFHRGYLEEGAVGASPALFSDSVLNASTGALSLAFGAKGPSHTLIGSSPVGLEAVAFGGALIESGRAEVCLVCASEVMEEITVEAYSKLGLVKSGPDAKEGFLPGEGAAVLVLEPFESAVKRGAKPLAEVSGSSFYSSGDLENDIRTAAERAIKGSGLDPGDLTNLIAGLNCANFMAEARALSGVLSASLRADSLQGLFGECFSASSLLSLAAASIMLSSEKGLAGSLNKSSEWSWAKGGPQEPSQNVLVSSIGLSGEAGCMVFKKVRLD